MLRTLLTGHTGKEGPFMFVPLISFHEGYAVH
jgi:hypothetical protein